MPLLLRSGARFVFSTRFFLSGVLRHHTWHVAALPLCLVRCFSAAGCGGGRDSKHVARHARGGEDGGGGGALPDETFRNVNMCQSWEPPEEQQPTTTNKRFTHYNAMTHMQRKKKETGPSPLACSTHHTWLSSKGFNLALGLIVGYFDFVRFFCCFFSLKVCSAACSRFLLFVFTARFLHITEDDPVLSFILLTLDTRQISNAIQQMRSLLPPGTLDCSALVDVTLPHTNSIIKKTRNLWFEKLVYQCVW